MLQSATTEYIHINELLPEDITWVTPHTSDNIGKIRPLGCCTLGIIYELPLSMSPPTTWG